MSRHIEVSQPDSRADQIRVNRIYAAVTATALLAAGGGKPALGNNTPSQTERVSTNTTTLTHEVHPGETSALDIAEHMTDSPAVQIKAEGLAPFIEEAYTPNRPEIVEDDNVLQAGENVVATNIPDTLLDGDK